MATTQYIGSRYVPILADPVEWSSTKTYEPLTIVTHEGNSYTSRQYVPQGIDITNEQFWALTGNYNAQVEQYRRETQQAVAQINDWYDAAVAEYADKYGSKPFAFDTVADMQNARNLLYIGAMCHTNGFYVNGDGGAAWYVVNAEGEPNGMDIIACGATLRAHLVITESVVTPEMFGAKGDGVSDDTQQVQKAFEHHNILLQNDYYVSDAYVDEYSLLTVSDNTRIVFNGSIKLAASSVGRLYIIDMTDKHNITLVGSGVIDGNRAAHIGEDEQWVHCINVIGGENITIDGITCINAWGDGIYIGNHLCKEVHVRNCTMRNNRRNNMSLTCCDGAYITGCLFAEANGQNPRAGIDIEPNAGQYCTNVFFDDCTFVDNETYNILVSIYIEPPVKSIIKFTDCRTNGQNSFSVMSPNVVIDVDNLTHESDAAYQYSQRIEIVEGSYLDFNCDVFNVTTGYVLLHSNANNVAITGNIYGAPQRLIHSNAAMTTLKNVIFDCILHYDGVSLIPDTCQERALCTSYNLQYAEPIASDNAGHRMPSYGCDYVIADTDATHSFTFYLTRLQVGTKFVFYNYSPNSMTINGVTVEGATVATFMCLKQGALSLVNKVTV